MTTNYAKWVFGNLQRFPKAGQVDEPFLVWLEGNTDKSIKEFLISF